MTIQSTQNLSRSLLLSAAASTAIIVATPAAAEPVLTATASAGPLFGIPSTETNTGMTDQFSFASNSDFQSATSASALSRTDYTNRSSADINGSGAASSSAGLSELVVNNTAETRAYTFNFLINAGNVGINSNGFGVFSTDEASAGFDATVTTDTGISWNTDVRVQLEAEAFTVADANNDDDGVLSGFNTTFFLDGGVQAFWNQTAFSIELGELAPMETLTLDYVISSSALAAFGDLCEEGEVFDEELGYGYGYGGGCYFTSAGISDPFGFSSLGITSQAVNQPPTPVAEPESLALLGIGLAGLGLTRRRRFKL